LGRTLRVRLRGVSKLRLALRGTRICFLVELGRGKSSGEPSYPDSRNASLVGGRGVWNAVRSLRVRFGNGVLSRSGREGTVEPV
jgi:hypothetical protein